MSRLPRIAATLFAPVLMALGCASLPSGQADGGWITLLDGAQGLDSWIRVGDANWRAMDGVVLADHKTDKASSFLLSRTSYSNFQLRAEFWVSADANSGIYLRCADPGNLSEKTCYEANIFDQRPDPAFGTGAIVNIAAVSPMPRAGGKWNTYEITVSGSHLVVTLNGVRTAEVQDDALAAGPIALQYAAGIVKFRKLQIRPLMGIEASKQ